VAVDVEVKRAAANGQVRAAADQWVSIAEADRDKAVPRAAKAGEAARLV
jgi:hypothetical protein